MKEFIKLKKYGQLYIDKVLFESYYPIIFTCVNDEKDVFIGVCCQNNEKECKWLLGKTNGKSVVKMLRDEITIRQLLLEYSSGKISVDYDANGYKEFYNNADWEESSPYLPKEDSYMYAEDGEFEDEINYFSMIDDHLPYDTENYKCIAKELDTEEIASIADALAAFSSVLENVSISGKIVTNALKVFGELCTNIALDVDKYMDSLKYEQVCNSAFDVSSEDLSIEVKLDNNNYTDAA